MKQLAAVFLLLGFSASAGFAAPAPARPFLDLDLEAPECSSGWQSLSRGAYELKVDDSDVFSGRQSFVMRYTGAVPTDPARSPYALLAQEVPPAVAAGKLLRIGGAIRTEAVSGGSWAGLWLEVFDSAGRLVTHVEQGGQGARGTTPWTRYEIQADIPADASAIYIGGELAGNGAAWFDAFSLDINGERWTDPKQPGLAPPTKQAVSWLRKQAIPVATVEARHGFADLQRLKKVIGNARIVSLGEQTHGTREFFQMKHRILEFLASEMGFTIFAIEANMPESYKVNDYILNGQGDPRALLRGMYFWTWNTQEVLDMIEWMREFNASGKGRVLFTGFDMQTTTIASVIVKDFVGKADPGYSGEAARLLDRVDRASQSRNVTFEDTAAARQVLEHLEARRDDYLARFSREEVDWAIQNARVDLQCMEDIARITSRDESMARNVDWILEQNPGAKIVLWAHNGHVRKSPGLMGSFLNSRHGRDMVTLGFAFHEGRYNAVDSVEGLRAWDALPPTPNAVESYLKASGIPNFILDLRRVPAASAAWLKSPRPFRSIGALRLRCASTPTVVSDEFDGLIFIERTNPSKLIRN